MRPVNRVALSICLFVSALHSFAAAKRPLWLTPVLNDLSQKLPPLNPGARVNVYNPWTASRMKGTALGTQIGLTGVHLSGDCLVAVPELHLRLQHVQRALRWAAIRQLGEEIRNAIRDELGILPLGLREKFRSGPLAFPGATRLPLPTPFERATGRYRLSLPDHALGETEEFVPGIYNWSSRTAWYRLEWGLEAGVRLHETVHHVVNLTGLKQSLHSIEQMVLALTGKSAFSRRPFEEGLTLYGERLVGVRMGLPPQEWGDQHLRYFQRFDALANDPRVGRELLVAALTQGQSGLIDLFDRVGPSGFLMLGSP